MKQWFSEIRVCERVGAGEDGMGSYIEGGVVAGRVVEFYA